MNCCECNNSCPEIAYSPDILDMLKHLSRMVQIGSDVVNVTKYLLIIIAIRTDTGDHLPAAAAMLKR